MITDKAKWLMDSDGCWLALKTSQKEACALCESMKTDKQYDVTITQHREKRSRDANAYMWVLIGKLSVALRQPPRTIYRELIRDIGGNYKIMPVRNDAVDEWIRFWEHGRIGWVCESIGAAQTPGYTLTINYAGSSCYDTKQMSRLIDEVVGLCKEHGVETLPPHELDRLKEAWNEKQTKQGN